MTDYIGLVAALRDQKQCDDSGESCAVSRQAVDEAANEIERLTAHEQMLATHNKVLIDDCERLTTECATLKHDRYQHAEAMAAFEAVVSERDTMLKIVRRVHQKMHSYLAIYTGDKELFKILDDCKSAMKETP